MDAFTMDRQPSIIPDAVNMYGQPTMIPDTVYMYRQLTIIPDTVTMYRQPNIIPAKQRTIVDLKAKKRVKSCDSSVVKHLDQPKEKIPTLVKNQLNYREGTRTDILELLRAKSIFGNEGIFLEGKVPLDSINYQVKQLKNGGFSKSIWHYESLEKSQISYICKQVKAEKFNSNEVKSMCQLNDMNICQIYGFVRTPDEYHIYMEFCGLNLDQVVKDIPLPIAHIVDITKQLCMAVEFAHNNKIIHLDIKPMNICLLFTSNGILLKLTDWGSSKRDDHSTEIQGITLYYASPEILYLYICQQMKLYQGQVPKKAIELTQKFCHNYNNIALISTMSDSFSIGLTLIFARTKRSLYIRQNKILDISNLIEMFAENPDTAKDLLSDSGDLIDSIVKKLVEGDSRRRISVKSVLEMIREYKQNSIPVNQDTKQCVDNDMPDPVNQEYNMPHFDLIF